MDTEKYLGFSQDEILATLLDLGLSLLIAVVIFIIGMRLAKFFSKMVVKILEKRDSDKGLITFMKGLVSGLIKVLTVITVFSQLGIEMTSFIAILGAAGLAIGMAFSGTLSNLAGGVMILIFKPFKVGDYIECQGEAGTVKEIQIFHTVMTTPDNKTIIVPNGPLYTGNITNYSMQWPVRYNNRLTGHCTLETSPTTACSQHVVLISPLDSDMVKTLNWPEILYWKL